MSVRVLLVDDQPLMRTGFRMILEETPTIEVVGEADNGRAALHLAFGRCRWGRRCRSGVRRAFSSAMPVRGEVVGRRGRLIARRPQGDLPHGPLRPDHQASPVRYRERRLRRPVLRHDCGRDEMPNLGFKPGDRISMRLVHSSMNDGKIAREIAYEMARPYGGPTDGRQGSGP
jgi:hypothetical protein